MPNVEIEIRRQYPLDQEERIIDAVHSAVVEGLKIPVEDKTIRLEVHEPHRFPVSQSKTDRYTLINIDLLAGRSLAAKKTLYRAIVRNLEPLGIPPDQVKIPLRESPSDDWAIRGGLPASDVDLDFEVNV